MRLTKRSDCSLRVLIYLAVHPERPITLGEISRAYRVSSHVLAKAVQPLIEDGTVTSVRGRHGGLRLGRAPDRIRVGAMLRRTESTWDVAECFDRETNTCPIEPACGLKSALRRAQRAFLGVLDEYTLEDLLPRPGDVRRLLYVPREGSVPA